VFTEPLPSNDRGMHIESQRGREVFMKYAVKIGSGAMIYISSSIKIGSSIQKLIRRIHRHTDSMKIANPTLIFFKINNES
jgi:hypothetical protein